MRRRFWFGASAMCIPLAKRRFTAVRGYCGSASPLCDYLSSLLVARHRELAAISERSARRKGERGRSLGVAQKVERKVVSRWHFRVENTLVASEYIRGDYEPSSLYPATCMLHLYVSGYLECILLRARNTAIADSIDASATSDGIVYRRNGC